MTIIPAQKCDDGAWVHLLLINNYPLNIFIEEEKYVFQTSAGQDSSNIIYKRDILAKKDLDTQNDMHGHRNYMTATFHQVHRPHTVDHCSLGISTSPLEYA
ncbi:hypothetical protein ACJIZ3_008542 [Penstemon smallii]|uniref:Uncharacterized protein n=1 Tax=Penstemon smallii TaxID=265156 RepID=A0ABD3TB12_9LAMI